jgi:hypothetical protein
MMGGTAQQGMRSRRSARRLAVLVAASAMSALGSVAVASADVTQPTGVTFQAVAGQAFTGAVAQFHSEFRDVDNFSATIDWGDGGPRSAGTIASCASCGPIAYSVNGSHTYAGPGSYTVVTLIRSTPDSTSGTARGTANVTAPPGEPPGGPPAGGSPPSGAPSLQLQGPAALTFGEPATFTAAPGGPGFVHYQWDFDGSASFATDGGSSPHADHGFAKPGAVHVGVRATDGAGHTAEAFLDVTVERPALASLRWSPFNPKPGQKVHFTLDNIHDAHGPVAFFSWRFGGLAPKATSIGLRRGGAKAAATGGSSGPLIVGHGDLSLTNQFTRTFPHSGVYDIEASAVGADGSVVTQHAAVGIGTKAQQVQSGDDVITAHQCAEDDDLPCPQIGVSGELVTGSPIIFDGSIPKHQRCFDLANPNTTKIQQAKDLGYPPEFGGSPVDVGGGAPVAIGGARARAASGGSTCIDLDKIIGHKTSQPRQWDFGDGVKVPAGAVSDSKGAPEVISHVYANAGTKKVSLTSRVFVAMGPDAKKTPQAFPIYVKQTIEVHVVKVFCGALHLHGVPVTTNNGCFVPISLQIAKVGDNVGQSYRAFAGDWPTLNGNIAISPFNFLDPAPIIRPGQAQIAALKGELDANFSAPGVSLLLHKDAFTVPTVINVPAPTFNAELGRKVAESPDLAVSAYASLAGLGVKGGHIYLSAEQNALADLNLELPPVFTGTARVKLGGGASAVARAADSDDADFSAELPAVKVGPFETDGVVIHHRKLSLGGGWYGGGGLKLFGIGLEAPYVPPSSSSAHCAKGGPSGFSLAENGDFQFAGATLTINPDIILDPTTGLLGLHCLQVAGSAEPFTLQGKVGLHVPANAGVIGIDACFLIAILDGGQSASGCGTSYQAKQNETWLRGAGAVSLFDTIDLASAHFDVHKGNDLLKFAAGGGVDYDFVVASLEVSVEGIVVAQPHFAFEFSGKGEICVGPFCPDVAAIVSSKGIAACAAIIGFEYVWGDGADVFGGCDLSDSPVHIARAARTAAASPAGRPVRVAHGLPAISFEAAGADVAPRVAVTDPRGRHYADDGNVVQRNGEVTILHLDQAKKTIVTVRGGPPGGTWSVAALPGSAAITSLVTRQGLPPTHVSARVRGHGASRRLVYRVAPVPGQTVTFFEEGRTVGREIGVAHGPSGSLPFPKGYGTAGRREIFATIAVNGMPRRRLHVTSYTAPRPPTVAKPARLRAHVARGKLSVSWTRARGATRYRLALKTGDGRVRTLITRRVTISVPHTATFSARVRLVAVAADGRESKPVFVSVKARRQREVIHF